MPRPGALVPDSAAMQFAEHARWLPALGIGYHLAVDGISVLFVGLTAFLTVLVVIYSWDTVRNQVRLYFMALLALKPPPSASSSRST